MKPTETITSDNKVLLKKNEEKRISEGYQWIFSNEIERVEGDPQNGDIVNIFSNNDKFIGKGLYNKNSLIAVRFLTKIDEEIDDSFFKERILSAYTFRKKIFHDQNIYRLVYSESDFLSGLIIDRYEEDFVIQTYSIGMDLRIDTIKNILIEIFNPRSIIERNESKFRQLEGMESRSSVIYGDFSPHNIEIDGIVYSLDLLRGQKTGFFLDQRENRINLRKYVKDCIVLDCFCNEGGFSLNAAYGGAAKVIGIDISKYAIQKAQKNASLNNLEENCEFIVGDVFNTLIKYAEERNIYDVVILDPPSFTKSKQNLPSARTAYKKINSLAMKILKNDGILITSSCSRHLFENEFLKLINDCARRENCKLQMLENHSACADHPILLSMPETKYLKFAIFRVMKA